MEKNANMEVVNTDQSGEDYFSPFALGDSPENEQHQEGKNTTENRTEKINKSSHASISFSGY